MVKKIVLLLSVCLFVLFSLNCISALWGMFIPSNESISAYANISLAEICLEDLVSREIPIQRVNESYQEALQMYDAQLALEEQGKKADYDIVVSFASDVCGVKEIAIETEDELEVFIGVFEEARDRINVSSMEEDYSSTLLSFEEERFEETLKLIEKGYGDLSELEASQTAVKLFYATTTRSLKDFFINNWKKLLIITGVVLLVLIISWKAIQKIKIRLKLKNLLRQKNTLNLLIKKLQYGYFEKKDISESEFGIKLEKFKEMIRDINRQIPLLKEQMIRLNKEKPGAPALEKVKSNQVWSKVEKTLEETRNRSKVEKEAPENVKKEKKKEKQKVVKRK
ncbi:MAG: hypothetical protein ABII03_00100 [Nanoarchaeota archaeon]